VFWGYVRIDNTISLSSNTVKLQQDLEVCPHPQRASEQAKMTITMAMTMTIITVMMMMMRRRR
jgi:hypothetical protein